MKSTPSGSVAKEELADTATAAFLGYRGDDDVPSSPAMLDNNGSLVWSGLNDGWGPSMDFRVQYYKGEPVLTFFQGA